MVDVSQTIAAKSDQLNADDLIGGCQTITVTGVTSGSAEQPINIFYEGCNGKPWRPCKSMRRVMVHVWGPDGATYSGKSLTLYRDEKVKFGSMAVGGIRISHVSHIDSDQQLALMTTKGKRSLYTVKALKIPVQTGNEAKEEEADGKASDWKDRTIAKLQGATSLEQLQAFTAAKGYVGGMKALKERYSDMHDEVATVATAKAESFSSEEPAEDPFAPADAA